MAIDTPIDNQPCRDDARVLSAAGKQLGAEWNLKCTGHLEQFNIPAVEVGMNL